MTFPRVLSHPPVPPGVPLRVPPAGSFVRQQQHPRLASLHWDGLAWLEWPECVRAACLWWCRKREIASFGVPQLASFLPPLALSLSPYAPPSSPFSSAISLPHLLVGLLQEARKVKPGPLAKKGKRTSDDVEGDPGWEKVQSRPRSIRRVRFQEREAIPFL